MNGKDAALLNESFQLLMRSLDDLVGKSAGDLEFNTIRTKFQTRIEEMCMCSPMDTGTRWHVRAILTDESTQDRAALGMAMIVMLRAETVPTTAPGSADWLNMFRGDLFGAVRNAVLRLVEEGS